jgi:hypothetical protein
MSMPGGEQRKPPSRVAKGWLKPPSTIQTHNQTHKKEGYLNLKGWGYRGDIAR